MSKSYTHDSNGEPITVVYDNVTGTRDDTCTGNRHAYQVRVVRGRKTVWKPKSPLCSPSGASTARIVEEVVSFYEHAKSEGETLGGVGRKRRRKRR